MIGPNGRPGPLEPVQRYPEASDQVGERIEMRRKFTPSGHFPAGHADPVAPIS